MEYRDNIKSIFVNWLHHIKGYKRHLSLAYIRRRVVIWMAVKSLLSKKFRTILTLGGIIIGFAAILFLVSFGWGLEQIVVKEVTGSKNSSMLDVTTGGSSVLRVTSDNINEWRQINSVSNVGAYLELPTHIEFDKKTTDGVSVISDDEYLNIALSTFKDKFTKESQNEAVISKKLAETLGLGDEENIKDKEIKLTLMVNRNYQKKASEDVQKVEGIKVKIIGLTDETEALQLYMPYGVLSKNNVSGFSHAVVVTKSSKDIPIVRKIIENQGFTTDYIGDTVSQITQVFGLFRVVLASFGLIALIVASIGMLNTLTISLLEKTKEVGLMKAIGVKRYDILRIFIYESLMLGGIGGICGILFGWLFSSVANYFINNIAGFSADKAIVLFRSPWWFYLILIGSSFILGFITGLMPALRASRLNPLDAIRYE